MEWVWVLRISLIIVICGLGEMVKEAFGYHATAQCVQLGQADYNRKIGLYSYREFNNSKGQMNPGYYTIGAYKFTTTHWFLDASSSGGPGDGAYETSAAPIYIKPSSHKCPYTWHDQVKDWINLCPTDKEVEIRTFAVKQNGVVMTGWLHFEVELKDRHDKIMAIYVQVRDEYFNAIGEFVTKEDEQCPADTKLATPSKYQILPCSAVGFREAKISNAVFMTRKDLLKYPNLGEQFLAKKDISRGIHFTWRLSEYWCNRHLRLRPEAIIFTEKMWRRNRMASNKGEKLTRVYRKAVSYWLFPHFYGSADIKLEATTLTCDEQVVDYKTGKILEESPGILVAPWLKETSELSTIDNDYFSNKQQYWDNTTETVLEININSTKKRYGIWSLKSCHANTRHPNQASFSGRCTHHYEKTPDHNALQGCNLNSNSPEFDDEIFKGLPTYQDYVIQLTVNRTSQCAAPCRIPMNINDLHAIQVFNTTFRPTRKPQVVKYVNIGATRHASKVQKFWSGRKFHGEMLVFWSMFLIPVGTFASRYLKETAMGYPCIGIHIWFWIHMATTVLGLGMMGCGLLGLYDILNTFGRSLNDFSFHHRGLTITSLLLYVFMAVIGGFRPTDYNMRIGMMLIHSVLGFVIYFFNLISIILSTWIPASPSMPNQCDEEGLPIGFSNVAMVTTSWLVLDVIFHIGMTLLQFWMDRQNGVTRDGFFCPIIPFLPENSASDTKGRQIRTILFIVYASMSLLCTMTVIGMLAGTQIDERCKNLTGPSTCEEAWGCSNWAMAYEEIYPTRTTDHPQAAN